MIGKYKAETRSGRNRYTARQLDEESERGYDLVTTIDIGAGMVEYIFVSNKVVLNITGSAPSVKLGGSKP